MLTNRCTHAKENRSETLTYHDLIADTYLSMKYNSINKIMSL